MMFNLQVRQSTGRHSTMTLQNHLSSAYLTKPEIISNAIVNTYKRVYPIQFLTQALGKIKELELGNREYKWYLSGDDERAISIIANLTTINPTTPGINNSLVTVRVAEDWFRRADVLVADSRSYRFRVKDDPYFDGAGWVLVMQYLSPNGDPTSFADPLQIAAGKRLSKEYSLQGEMSFSGSTTYSHPFEMKNHLTTIGKTAQVSRSAATDVLAVQVQSESGKSTNMWVQHNEWVMMEQWMREKERLLMYETYSADPQGVTPTRDFNGTPLYRGAGIRAQIMEANQREYTTFSETLLRDFMADLSINIAPQSSRQFVALTGERGMIEFDRAMKSAASQFQLVDSKFITGTGQELVLGGQFNTYLGPNNTKFTLVHFPLYDNVQGNRERHFQSGAPIESYRFTILDYGINGGESNIQYVHKKDSKDILWHVNGSIDAMGNTAKSLSTARSNNYDGYSVHALSECGVMIKNPTACGELICTAVK